MACEPTMRVVPFLLLSLLGADCVHWYREGGACGGFRAANMEDVLKVRDIDRREAMLSLFSQGPLTVIGKEYNAYWRLDCRGKNHFTLTLLTPSAAAFSPATIESLVRVPSIVCYRYELTFDESAKLRRIIQRTDEPWQKI